MIQRLFSWNSAQPKKLAGIERNNPQELFKEADEHVALTPDCPQLFRKDHHLIFVCDDMMMGRPNHHFIAPSIREYHGKAYTLSDSFTLFKHDLGVQSYLIPFVNLSSEEIPKWASPQGKGGYKGSPPATIRGEIYSLPPYTLLDLDKRFINGYTFERQRIKCIIPYVEKKWSIRENGWVPQTINEGHIVEPWFYIGVTPFWEKHLDGGFQFKPITVFHPNRKDSFPFYYHTGCI